ncbi:hypothetical protein SUGI_0051180 [Cryptomeria japonica]|nr:hypothetical protein SUGI_0051180 [Cryptomeria japonica]
MAEQRVSISAYSASNPEEDGGGEENKERQHHKKRSKDWTMAQTLKLIRLRTEFEPRFSERGKKLEIWNESAEALSTDARHCRDKWENLVASYKGVKDSNPFFQHMHPFMARKRKDRDCEDYNPFIEVARVCNETAARGYEADHNDVEMINYDDYYRGKEEWEAHKGEKCRLKPYMSAVNEIVGAVFEKEELLRDTLKNVERREEMRERGEMEGTRESSKRGLRKRSVGLVSRVCW